MPTATTYLGKFQTSPSRWKPGKNVPMTGAIVKTLAQARNPKNGDESPRRGAPIGIPEMNAASQVNGEEDRIQSQFKAVAGPILHRQKKNRKRSVKKHQAPAKRMVELADVEERNQRAAERPAERQPASRANGRRGDEEERRCRACSSSRVAASIQRLDTAAAMGNSCPHEEDARPRQRRRAENRGRDAEVARRRQKHEGGKMKNDHQPANEPYAGKRCSTVPRYRKEGQREQSNSRNIRDFAQVHEAHLGNQSSR